MFPKSRQCIVPNKGGQLAIGLSHESKGRIGSLNKAEQINNTTGNKVDKKIGKVDACIFNKCWHLDGNKSKSIILI